MKLHQFSLLSKKSYRDYLVDCPQNISMAIMLAVLLLNCSFNTFFDLIGIALTDKGYLPSLVYQ